MGQDLITKLGFYGAYHSNPINKLIHIVFVPIIEFCSLVLMISLTSPYLGFGWTNFGVIYCAVIIPYTLWLHLSSGLIRSVFLIVLTYYAHSNALNASGSFLWYMLGLKIFSWAVQVGVGHGIYEGRKPALMDGFLEAIFTAPLFVILESM
eukprot:TRINITY_DN10585_c0_g2_i4.p1 TRINITY_DN10585_c0_g2~~TRINITY_DN10585_c0_g2_i4.p1  ORF type:complete len:176 (+),score=28.79 TRINITY_DN10585_c0_g2_i4:78-530(+)